MRRRSFIAASLALAWAGVSFAQTADEIIAKNIEAVGGMKKIEKITSISRRGDLNLNGQFGEMTGTTEFMAVIGKKTYQAIDLGAYYRKSGWPGGDKGWQDDTMAGLKDISGDEIGILTNQSQVSPLVGYKKSGATATKLEDTKVEKISMAPPPIPASPSASGAPAAPAPPPPAPETVDCYTLEMTPPGGKPFKIYIDKKTNLLFQMRFIQTDEQFGEVEATVEYTEYEEKDGVKLVKNMKLRTGEVFTLEMIYNETTLNEAIDEKVFEKPEPPAPAVPAAATDPAPAAK